MDKQYFIELGFKTADGVKTIAEFFAGGNRTAAEVIFRKLQGNRSIDDSVIFISFVETINGLPVNLDMIGCTLYELGENCKIITTELFKVESLLPDVLKYRHNEKVY